MYNYAQDFLPKKTEPGLNPTSEIDCLALGGMAKPANRIIAGTAGKVWVVEYGDGSGKYLDLEADDDLSSIGYYREVALGNAAVLTATGGSYPAVLAADENLVLHLDENTIKDSGEVTITVPAGTYTLDELVELINAAFVVELDDKRAAVASNASGELRLTGRAHGTAAGVEVVAIGTTLASATGLSATDSASGNATDAAADLTIQW